MSLLALKWTMISIPLFSVAEKLNFSLSSLPSLKFFGGLLLVLYCLQNQSNSPTLPDFFFLLLNHKYTEGQAISAYVGSQEDGALIFSVSLIQRYIRLL